MLWSFRSFRYNHTPTPIASRTTTASAIEGTKGMLLLRGVGGFGGKGTQLPSLLLTSPLSQPFCFAIFARYVGFFFSVGDILSPQSLPLKPQLQMHSPVVDLVPLLLHTMGVLQCSPFQPGSHTQSLPGLTIEVLPWTPQSFCLHFGPV